RRLHAPRLRRLRHPHPPAQRPRVRRRRQPRRPSHVPDGGAPARGLAVRLLRRPLRPDGRDRTGRLPPPGDELRRPRRSQGPDRPRRRRCPRPAQLIAAIRVSLSGGRPGTSTSAIRHIGPSLTSFSVCRFVSPPLTKTTSASASVAELPRTVTASSRRSSTS